MIIKLLKKLVPKDAVLLLPGLNLKRWFVILIVGIFMAFIGLCIIFDFRPIYHLMNFSMNVASMNLTVGRLVGLLLIICGAYVFIKGWKHANYSILNVSDDRDRHAVIEDLYRRRKLNNVRNFRRHLRLIQLP